MAAKNGVVGLMNSLAIEGQPYNVKANAIAPWADTRMTAGAFSPEIAARVPPKFVSDLVVFLASEQCPVTHDFRGRFRPVRAGLRRSDHRGRETRTPSEVQRTSQTISTRSATFPASSSRSQ